MKFKDHFSAHAAQYAQFRPRYPEALFRYLASVAPDRACAWDCATGNGQAAIGLARHFLRVIATDASTQQITNAEAHERVTYWVANAEQSAIDESSVSLITVAQAFHWFDIPAFFSEAKRVLKPNGVLAVWAYNLLTVSPEIDAIVNKFYRETTGPYWPPEREMVESGYAEVAFPFEELVTPSLEIEERWTLHQLLGYLRSWSATQKFIAAQGFDPLVSLGGEIGRCWKEGEEPRPVRWPLAIRVMKSCT